MKEIGFQSHVCLYSSEDSYSHLRVSAMGLGSPIHDVFFLSTLRADHEVCAVPTSVDRFKLRREKVGHRQKKRGKRKRTRVEGGGPNQRGFTLSKSQTAGS